MGIGAGIGLGDGDRGRAIPESWGHRWLLSSSHVHYYHDSSLSVQNSQSSAMQCISHMLLYMYM